MRYAPGRTHRRIPPRGGWSLLALLVVGSSCNPTPTAVVLPPLEAVAAGGDEQYGTPGQALTVPLRLLVRTASTGLPRAGLSITWEVESGDATLVTRDAATDSAGYALATIRLGNALGVSTVRATVVEQQGANAAFTVHAVAPPTLTSVEPTTAAPGASVTLTGSDFSPSAEENVVLFSGVRGIVASAASDRLVVTVPSCLPERSVAISVQLGSVASNTHAFSVGAGGDVATLAVGGTVDLTDDAGYDCVTVPATGSEQYLVVPHSVSALSAGQHPFVLTGLTGSQAQPGQGAWAPTTPWETRVRAPGDESLQLAWDQELRALERAATRGRSAQRSDAGTVAAGPATVPNVGERRTFQVYQGASASKEVSAVVRHVGARAAIYVDETSPAGGFTDAELADFGQRFDDFIFPTVTGVFGSPSDVDGNERVVILFSPAVNALTSRGSTGFIAGFFYGLDLLVEREGSNKGEIFYAIVPDPNGTYSDPRPRDDVLDVMPAILAHEFEHMVHFNERVLTRDAEANEALWLSEALAQFAEELVARAYENSGSATDATLFRDGVRSRARRYLEAPSEVALTVTSGQGSLAERGAGFLFLLYLADRFGDEVAGAMTRTTRTGITNVEAAAANPWAPLASDWWSALYVDGEPAESVDTSYRDLDLRDFVGQPFPLEPIPLGSGDFSVVGTRVSGSSAYAFVEPSSGGTTTLRLGGLAGGRRAPSSGLRVRLVRLR